MTFVIRTSVSREVDKCQYGQVPVVQWIRNRMDVAPWCFKWDRIGMEWNEMGWKSLGYANSTYNAKISTYARGCRKNHNICALVSQITIYGHLCPTKKSGHMRTFSLEKPQHTRNFFLSRKNQNIRALWSRKKNDKK